MFEFRYKLNSECVKESNYYLATHDRKMQRQSITLAFSVATLISAATLLIFKINFNSLIIVIVLFALSILIFPRIYWKTVFKRIDSTLSNTNLSYEEIFVRFDDVLQITSMRKTTNVSYADIIKVDYTKSTCLIFYIGEGNTNTLIIPNEILDSDITKIYEFIEKMKEQYE